VQGASVAVDTKYSYLGKDIYINPIFIIPANVSTAAELKDIVDILKPVRDIWEAKESGWYQVYIDDNVATNIRKNGDTSQLTALKSEFYSMNGVASAYNKPTTRANLEINLFYTIYLSQNSLPYQVKAALLVSKDNANSSLSALALSAKYAMSVVFSGKSASQVMGASIESWQLENMFKQIYGLDTRIYYVGIQKYLMEVS